MPSLNDPICSDAAKACERFEAIRWPHGVICSHCGVVDQATLIQGKSHRISFCQRNARREPFTVTTGTVMASRKIPLSKWALAFHLIAASKQGVSAHRLHPMPGITHKTARFMAHRVRRAMGGHDGSPMGDEGKFVEADEAHIGRKPGRQKAPGTGHTVAVLSLVERGGKARSFRITDLDGRTLSDVLEKNVSEKTYLATDGYATCG